MNLTSEERRELAGELAEDLARRGLSLLDVERVAPLLVDQFRHNAKESREIPDGGACG